MSFDMDDVPLAQERDDGLSANECYPQELVNDPSFALLNRDPYVIRHGLNALWAAPPTPQLINGRTPPFRKRDISYLDPNEWVLEENNSSRRLGQDELDRVAEAIALDEQMHEVAAYIECVGDDCATSTTLISKYDSAIVIEFFILVIPADKEQGINDFVTIIADGHSTQYCRGDRDCSAYTLRYCTNQAKPCIGGIGADFTGSPRSHRPCIVWSFSFRRLVPLKAFWIS